MTSYGESVDAGALARMPALRSLRIVPGQVKVLVELPQVTQLECHEYEGSLGFLEGWKALETLDLRQSGKLARLETLAALPVLKRVRLRSSKMKREAWPRELQGKLDFVG
jgi:hypothetical protein